MVSRAATTAAILGFLAGAFVLSWMVQSPPRVGEPAAAGSASNKVVFLGTDGVILQNRRNDCGLAALAMILSHEGIRSSIDDIERRAGLSHRGASMLRLKDIAARFNLRASGWRIKYDDLAHVKLPAILFVEDRHFVVADSVDNRSGLYVRDPAIGRLRIPRETMEKKWKGEVLLFAGGSIEY